METLEPYGFAPTPAAEPAVVGVPDESSEAQAAPPAHGYMCFRVGPLGLLFPSDAAREVLAPPPVSRVPHTAAWLQGLANVRGELVPVVDAAAAFGVARDSRARTYLLLFGQGEAAVGVLIDGLPRLFDPSAAVPRPTPTELPDLLAGSVIGACEHDGRTWLDIDVDQLLDALARRAPHA